METLTPKDHAEEVALFRSEVVGALTRLELPRGELAARLELLSKQRFRPPGASATRTFAVPTLERWYRLYKRGGLAALRSEPRSDRGAARALTPEQQELVCEVRGAKTPAPRRSSSSTRSSSRDASTRARCPHRRCAGCSLPVAWTG